ncbi:MAG: aldehyde dehydrogenase family protein [Deltaproteobacteria bacterium]|nr:aldehyde dehydrogenase family protein [Deltaproteobacteria bacterium]
MNQETQALPQAVRDFKTLIGGYKQSGFGRKLGLHSLELYTQIKSVWLKV